MSVEAAVQQNTPSGLWSGGKEPFRASYGKVMMWFFLVSDAFTFASFLIAYGYLRFSSPWWPDPNIVFNAFPGLGEGFPLLFVSLMTFILIASSVTMVLAVYEGHHMNKQNVVLYLLLTILGGAMFLGCQAIEWTHLIHNGLSLSFNPYVPTEAGETMLVSMQELMSGAHFENGPKGFGMVFFVVTGFHGSHVFSGVVLLIIALVQTIGGIYERRGHYEMVEKIGLYWHFVDLVWVFVFLLFYLI